MNIQKRGLCVKGILPQDLVLVGGPFQRRFGGFSGERWRGRFQPLGKARQAFWRLIRAHRYLPPPILHLFLRLKVSVPGIVFDSFPRCTTSNMLRYEKEIKALHLFRLLSLEMLHRRVEIEKQDFKKKSTVSSCEIVPNPILPNLPQILHE